MPSLISSPDTEIYISLEGVKSQNPAGQLIFNVKDLLDAISRALNARLVVLPEADVEYVKTLTEKMATQNNRATQNPLYYVYEKVGHAIDTTISDYDRKIYMKDGEQTAEEEDADYTVYEKDFDEPVLACGPFLTEESAQDHIERNGYHYNEPFTYVDSMWRNKELQRVVKLLFEIAGRPMPSFYG